MRLPRAILDPIIRHSARLHAVPLDRYTVRIARSEEEYLQAFTLLRTAYIIQGWEKLRSGPMRITPHHVLPEATVLVAYEGDSLVGTMSVTMDSPAGLPIDGSHGREAAGLRQRGARMAEYGSLAVVERCWGTGVTLLLNLAAYHIAHYYYGATHTVVAVAPKGEAFYRALFDFRRLGAPVRYPDLALDVVALVQDMNAAKAFVRKHYRRPLASGRRLVDHFLDVPPSCVQLPPRLSAESLARWKLPRHVFQRLFVELSDRLETINPAVREYLATRRSRATLQLTDGLDCMKLGT